MTLKLKFDDVALMMFNKLIIFMDKNTGTPPPEVKRRAIVGWVRSIYI